MRSDEVRVDHQSQNREIDRSHNSAERTYAALLSPPTLNIYLPTNIYDLTPNHLKRAAAIKEQIERLNKELRSIFGAPSSRAAPKKNQTMSASTEKKIAATQKARWAKLRLAKPAVRSAKPTGVVAKKPTNASANARRSAKLKAYWAAKKTGKK